MSNRPTASRETRSSLSRGLDDLWTDLRLAMRNWRRNPGLALVVTTILTVGIGIGSAGFTLINDEFFRSSTTFDPDSFVSMSLARTTTAEPPADFGGFAVEDVEAIQQRSRSLARSAAWRPVAGPVGDVPALVGGRLATCDIFSVLGPVRPLLGRLLDQNDCRSAARVTVIGERLWRSRFNADPGVIGRVVSYNVPLTIVGVLPSMPGTGWPPAMLWIPYTLSPAWSMPASGRAYRLMGRLAPGQTPVAASAELNVIMAQLDGQAPGRHSKVRVSGDGSAAAAIDLEDWGRPILLIGVVTMMVLLVSATVVTLILARAHARKHEIAIRLSLGAGTGRLLRMLITETTVLALVAAAVSVLIAYHVPQLLVPLLETDPARQVPPDWRVWTFLAAITLLAAVASGLTPALEALKVNTADSLKGRPGAGPGKEKLDPRAVLVVVQISIAVALLGGAAAFMRGYLATVFEDPGFETRQTMLVRLTVWGSQPISWPIAQQDIARQVRALPGVENVAFSEDKPALGRRRTVTSASGLTRRVRVNGVSPSFFETLGIPLLRGRALQPDDPVTGSLVPVVVSQRLATELLPGLDPLGQLLRAADGAHLSVVGVAGDVAQPGRTMEPSLYRPLPPERNFLLVRFAGDPVSAVAAVSSAVRRAVPGIYGLPQTFRQDFDGDIEEIGDSTALVMILGVTALLLALLGVYGTVAFMAQRRTKEMAIRAALGASGRDILRALTTGPRKYVALGLGIGLAVAVLLVQAAGILKRNLQAADPIPYAAAGALVAAAAFVAMLRPARRAMTADPIAALRED